MKTNREVATELGISESMASRLRTGDRRPSGSLFIRIINKYDLDAGEALRAMDGGDVKLAAYLRQHVFKEVVADA